MRSDKPLADGRTDHDEELVAAVASARDAAAFRILVDRHAARALRMAERILQNRADAEDAVQEAFQRLWRDARRFQPARGRFRSWFIRVLINACRDRQRQLRRRPVTSLPDMTAAAAETEGVERLDRVQAVRQAIAALPERQRWAVVLTYYEGLSNREAAAAMGISVKALEALLVRARRHLSRSLAGA
ncbi:MAG: sigma-70 family RNA polymerase sigma factor [Alphaproteobacteria bacterium]|nr:MAG: sigma-70 family RNA polymerase sigma factor [Alphaproteobacteria bacterium]